MINWPDHLKKKHPNLGEKFSAALLDYFKSSKGIGGAADFLCGCEEDEIPEWIRNVCKELKGLCQPDGGNAEEETDDLL